MVLSPSPHILLVDDENALLLSYKIIFQREGYTISTAATTADALTLLSQQTFDILLCDLTMERAMSGLEIIAAARRAAPSMPVVLMTGYTSDSVPQEVIDRDVNMLFKPVEIPRLLDTVDFLVRASRQRNSERSASAY